MSFGSYIKQLRKERRMTQRTLSEKAGVDYTYLSKIENDRLEYTPSIRTIQALARALGVDELDLMQRADKAPPGVGAIAGNADALRFFRRAAETIQNPEEWRDLLSYLERKQQPDP